MKFDYYAATLPAAVTYCEDLIKKSGDGVLQSEKPVNPYKRGFRHSETGFRLYWGGQNPHPFFVVSGSDAVAGAEFVRSHFPKHRVARADVALDLDELGGFDRLHKLIEPIVRKAGVAVQFQGDPDPSKKTGRTMYYGSPTSDVRICMYEKGLHERGKGNLEALEGWVRVEVRVRPRKQRKALCASLSASDICGLSKWTAQVCREVLATTVPFVPDPSLRVSKVDQAIIHMFRQYAGSIRAFVDQYGQHKFYEHCQDVIHDEEEKQMRVAEIIDDLSLSELLNALKNMGSRLEIARSKGQGERSAEIASDIAKLRGKIEAMVAT